MKTALAVAALVFFAFTSQAQASSPVNVNYTVSGGAGSWLLDFSVSDNLGGTNSLYYFGVRLSGSQIAASPTGWSQPSNASQNWNLYGGSNTEYNNLWITGPSGSNIVLPGHSLGGFEAIDTGLTAPSNVSWFAVSAGGTYPSLFGCSFICQAPFDNPGFEGVANISPSPIPELAAPVMLVIGLIAGASWLRRRC